VTATPLFTRDAPVPPSGVRFVAIILIAGVVLLLLPYVTGLIGAGVLYVVARPVMNRLDSGVAHRSIAFTVVFGLFVIIVLPGAWLLAELVAQVPDAAQGIQQSAAVERLMAMRLGDVPVGALLAAASSEIIAWSSRQTMMAIGEVMSATLNLVIALFGAYYLLTSADRIWERTRLVLPFAQTTSETLRVRFHRTTEAMLLGVVLTGVAQGTLVGVLFWMTGLPHPLLWGGVTAFTSLLPLFGSALVWLPGSLLLLAQDRYAAAAALAGSGALIVSNVDNALRLIVYRRVSQIHPMVTLVGAFAGVRAFGMAGVLIGPLVLSYMIELFKLQRAADVSVREATAA
jgi:predicted PurR-regulated permease PerM